MQQKTSLKRSFLVWALGYNLRTFLIDCENAKEFERLLKQCAQVFINFVSLI